MHVYRSYRKPLVSVSELYEVDISSRAGHLCTKQTQKNYFETSLQHGTKTICCNVSTDKTQYLCNSQKSIRFQCTYIIPPRLLIKVNDFYGQNGKHHYERYFQ